MATPQQIAEATRDAMWAKDRASQGLGMQVLAVGPTGARLLMAVRDDMLNGHNICHGGFIATLADSAFAFACNAGNEATVASGFDIQLLAPAHLGDVLTADAEQVHRRGRTGVYDVAVSNQRGEAVALFRGRSHGFKGQVVVQDAALTPVRSQRESE